MNLISALVSRLLVGLMVALGTTVACAQPSPIVLPAPEGMSVCAPDDPVNKTMQRVVAAMGDLIGCFHSTERIKLHGVPRDIDEPLETAFALNIAPSLGPYVSQDLEAMYFKVSEQWKNYKPLNHQVRPEYERQVNALIASSLPSNSPTASIKLEPPVLVSMERVGNDAYMVISIRQRTLQMAGETVVSTQVDSTAITLRKGALIRLSLTRELRGPKDVSTVHDATSAWLARVRGEAARH